jgi:hypothetical protein
MSITEDTIKEVWLKQRASTGRVTNKTWEATLAAYNEMTRTDSHNAVINALSRISGRSVDDVLTGLKAAKKRRTSKRKIKLRPKSSAKTKPQTQPKKTITIYLNGVPVSGDAETITLILNQLGAV